MWVDQRGSEILTRGECLRLLARGSRESPVGRIGVQGRDAPIVLPVTFAFVEDGIVASIGPGRLSELAPGSLVAFEVDHVDRDAHEAWDVLVRGLATELTAEERARLGERVPRPVIHVPGDRVLRIRPDVVTGRRFSLDTSRGEDGPPDPSPA